MLHTILYILIVLFLVAGLAISLANLPGIWLVYVGILIYSVYTDFSQVGLQQLLLLLVVSVGVSLIDNIVVPFGAKKYGSSTWGMVGAILGGLVGTLLGGPVGMLVGPLLGATLFEVLFARKDYEKAFRAGIGAALGFFVSVVLKFGATAWLVIWILGKMF